MEVLTAVDRFGPLALATGAAVAIVLWAQKPVEKGSPKSVFVPPQDTPPSEWSEPAEGFAAREMPSGCDPGPKKGAVILRDYGLDRWGGQSAGIGRECGGGNPSHHHEGRAWDWAGVTPGSPRVESMLRWLLANDAEMFRRAGLEYVIWNKKIFSSSRPKWSTYCTGSPCLNAKGQARDPHTSHVHFSLSRKGARGDTSFYRANPLAVS